MNKLIVEVHVIPSLLSCLKRTERTDSEESGLKNFFLLLKRQENSQEILKTPGWQKWLFPLLFEKGKLIDQNTMQYKLTISILTNLHFMWMADTKKPDGDLKGNVMFESIVILRRLHMRFNKQSADIARALLMAIFSTIKARVRDFTRNFDFDHFAWNNVFNLLSVAEEFIFYTKAVDQPKAKSPGASLAIITGIWFEDKKQCSDLATVEKVLEVLKALELTDKEVLPSASISEKKWKKHAEPEVEFWTAAAVCLKGLTHIASSSVEGRKLVMTQLSKTLSDRNKNYKHRVYEYRRNKEVIVKDMDK